MIELLGLEVGSLADWVSGIATVVAIFIALWQVFKTSNDTDELEFSKVRPFLLVELKRKGVLNDDKILYHAKDKNEQSLIESRLNSILMEDRVDQTSLLIPKLTIINVNEFPILAVQIYFDNQTGTSIHIPKIESGQSVSFIDGLLISALDNPKSDPIPNPEYKLLTIHCMTIRREKLKLCFEWIESEERFKYSKEKSALENKSKEAAKYDPLEQSKTYTYFADIERIKIEQNPKRELKAALKKELKAAQKNN